MIFESDVVVDALVALEQQLVELRGHFGELAAASGRGNFTLALAATTSLRRILDKLAVTITTIKTQALGFDHELADEPIGSLGELALRAMTLVVALQLNKLGAAIHDAAEQAPERSQALFVGRFRNIDDVAAFVQGELATINHTWEKDCMDDEGHTGLTAEGPEQRRAHYRRAVREAQQAVVMLGRDPDLAYLLHEGAARLDWLEVHTACVQIAATIGIRLEAEPDLSRFSTQRAP